VYSATVASPMAGLDPGTRVALKVVHPHLLGSPGYFKRFMQEAEIGRRVRHANVVRTFEVDAIEVDGTVLHYLAMEIVEGKNLREFLREFGVVPEAILREIALQCAAGLAAIHAERIVHRDIKPENILITDDNEIRIMDLGVAKMLEMSLTKAGAFAGSMLYGAPEQFSDGAVGPAADLYSLGLTLYELASGDLPFRRESQSSVINAHLHQSPPPLAQRNPDVTRFFSELVAKLVAKDPTERFASAQILQLTLEEAERSAWWAVTEPLLDRAQEELPKIPVRRETELHGREDVLAKLREAWTDACGGRGSVVFIEGEAGVGKTRVLDAFVHSLGAGKMHVLYGSYPPSGGAGGVSDAIVGKFGEAELARTVAPYLTVTPSLVPAFAALVTQAGQSADDALSWDAFMAVCVHLMQALAEERPLLWMVDDFHFAPKESRDLILALARAVAGRQVLLLVTARPGVPADELAHLGRLEQFTRLALRRLGAREVVELLRSAFQSETLAHKLGGSIAHKSDGVPFFIFEMIRGLEQGQFIRRLPDGSYVQSQVIDAIEVPSAVKDLIEGRLRNLDKHQRAILDVGSVQGLRFDPALVAGVLEMKLVRVLQDSAQTERMTGLVRGGVRRVEFDQHQIQEVLYGALLPDLRREYHTLLAEAAAQRLGGEPTDADSAFLASHYLQGSAPERGLPHLAAALGHMERNFRNEDLIVLAERALELEQGLDPPARVDVLLRQADRLGLVGRRDREHRALTEAAELANVAGDSLLQARARVALAQHLVDTSQFTEAIKVAEGTAAGAEDPELQMRAEGVVGRALLNLGRFAEARPHFERRLELARECGDRQSVAAARGDLGLLEKSLGSYAEAHAHFEAQLEIALEGGDRQGEASATGNLGTACKVVGRLHEARTYLERHCELARKVGDRMGEASATGNLGLVLKNLGLIADARALFEQSLEISREIDSPIGEARAAGHLGLVAKNLGRHEEAQAYFVRSRDLSREVGDVHGEVIATGNIGNVLFDLGRFEDALAHYREWFDAAREMGDRQGEVVALGNIGNALDALGRIGDAYDQFEQSRRIACEIGDREGEGIALADQGAVLLKMGVRFRAQKKLEQALTIVRELGVRRSEGYVLHGLGVVAEQVEDVEDATVHYEEARDVYREIRFAAGEPETELALGRICANSDVGRQHFERAQTMARTLDMPSVFVRAACWLGTADAAQLLSWHEGRMNHEARMESHFVLWDSTADRAHLAQAHRLLAAMRDHAAATYRDSMIDNVPLHRRIAAAWEQRAGVDKTDAEVSGVPRPPAIPGVGEAGPDAKQL